MEYHSDYTYKLVTKDQDPSILEKWCLRPLDESGDPAGPDLITWNNPLYFEVTNPSYVYDLITDDPSWERFGLEANCPKTDGRDLKLRSSEKIIANLVSLKRSNYPRALSMVGSNQNINKISLSVTKQEEASCSLIGTPEFYDLDNELHNDSISVFVQLPPEKFEELAGIINSGGASSASLSVYGLSGLYSEDYNYNTPIKVLTGNLKGPKLNLPEDTSIDPPRLGRAREFDFQLNKNYKTKGQFSNKTNSVHVNWAKKQTKAFVKSLPECSNEIGADAKENLVIRLRRTRKYKLMNEMFCEASIYAGNTNLEANELAQLSSQIHWFFSELDSAFQPDERFDHANDPEALADFYERTWKMWQHQKVDFYKIRKDEVTYFDRESLVEGVVNYLALPIRNQNIERMLVDALMAAEIVAYADQMLNFSSKNKHLSVSPFAQSHPLWSYIKDQAVAFVITAGIPWLMLFTAIELFDLKGNWPFFLGYGFFGLWVLLSLIGLSSLPGFWSVVTLQKRNASELLQTLDNVYNEIGAGRILSARHIRERLYSTADQGVVWPAEVFPLLDDIIDRGGVF